MIHSPGDCTLPIFVRRKWDCLYVSYFSAVHSSAVSEYAGKLWVNFGDSTWNAASWDMTRRGSAKELAALSSRVTVGRPASF